MRVWFVVALVLVAVGILAAPSRRRRGDNGSVGHWVAQRRAALVASAVAIALGAVVWWEHPTLPGLLVTAGVVAAVILGVFVVSGRAMGELEALMFGMAVASLGRASLRWLRFLGASAPTSSGPGPRS